MGGAPSTAIALMVVLGLVLSSLGTEAAKINPSTTAASSLGGKAEIKRSGSNWGYREDNSPQTKDDLAHSVRRNWMDNFTEWELGQFIRCLNDCQPWLFSDFGYGMGLVFSSFFVLSEAAGKIKCPAKVPKVASIQVGILACQCFLH